MNFPFDQHPKESFNGLLYCTSQFLVNFFLLLFFCYICKLEMEMNSTHVKKIFFLRKKQWYNLREHKERKFHFISSSYITSKNKFHSRIITHAINVVKHFHYSKLWYIAKNKNKILFINLQYCQYMKWRMKWGEREKESYKVTANNKKAHYVCVNLCVYKLYLSYIEKKPHPTWWWCKYFFVLIFLLF